MNNQRAKKLIPLLLALALVMAAVWVTGRFGLPPPSTNSTRTESSTGTASQTRTPGGALAAGQSAALQGLLGFAQSSMQAGEVSQTPESYTESLERLYAGRGYQPTVGQSGQKPASKFYWRADAGGFLMICAVGADANPHTGEKDERPQIYSTLISGDGKGGARWMTLRYELREANATAAQQALNTKGDMPGEDPRGVPRPPGLRRLFSITRHGSPADSVIAIYKVAEGGQPLNQWYLRAMSAGWELDPVATAQARGVGNGILCFARGDKYCLVWIEPAPEDKEALLIVSSNYA